MLKEIWIDIKGYEGLYQVSNLGRVKSLRRTKPNGQTVIERILKECDNMKGYKNVCLSKHGIMHKEYVHRLVAMHFLDNPMNYKYVNHKDENKNNNIVNNLEWCSAEYNNNYGTAKMRSKKTYVENGHNRAICMYSLDGKLIRIFERAYDIRLIGINRRGVYANCNHISKTYKGYVFRFIGDPFTLEKNIKKKGKVCIWKYDLDKNLIAKYDSVTEAQVKNGMKRNYLYGASYAKRKEVLFNNYIYSYKKM